MAKEKSSIFKTFKYSFKVVFKNQKSLIFIRLIILITDVLLSFISPLAVAIAINAIEKGLPIRDGLIQIIIITIVEMIIQFIMSLAYRIEVVKETKLYNILCVDYSLKSLVVDYEKYELADVQNLFERGRRAYSYNGAILTNIRSFFGIIKNIIIFVGTTTIISFVNPWIIPAVILLAIVTGLFNKQRIKIDKKYNDNKIIFQRKINYANNVSKNLGIMKDKKVYEMNKFVDKERNKVIDDYLTVYKKQLSSTGFISALVNVIYYCREFILYFFVGIEALSGKISIATFSYVIAYIKRLSSSVSTFITNYNTLYQNSLYIHDYFAILEYQKDSDSTRDEVDYSNCDNVEIEFKNVYYQYYNQEGYALEDVSFKIKKGERIALVGENGAGKTTMVKLLCGFYHPTKGNIFIDGKDIETIKRSSLNKLVAAVFQDDVIFALTIKENVTMQEENQDEYLYKDSLKVLELDKKIETLDDKDDTILNRDIFHGGTDLSGGEKQKVHVSRAIYKNSPLMILDEPTSNLDAFAERNFYDKLDDIIKNHSSIFISHRLSSSKFCNKIIVLEKGHIVEEGTHDELIKLNGQYANLFSVQAALYQNDSGDKQ